MPRYEWTGDGEFRDNRNDRRIEPGETVELPERVGEPQAELVARDDSPDPPFDPGEYSVVELRDELDGLTDAELDALSDAESGGNARTTALDAIESAQS